MASDRKYIAVYSFVSLLTLAGVYSTPAISQANQCEAAFSELTGASKSYVLLVKKLSDERLLSAADLTRICESANPLNPLLGREGSISITNYSRAFESLLSSKTEWHKVKEAIKNTAQEKENEQSRETRERIVTNNIFHPYVYGKVPMTGKHIHYTESFDGPHKLLLHADDTGIRVTDISSPNRPVEWEIPKEFKAEGKLFAFGNPFFIQLPTKTLLVSGWKEGQELVVFEWENPSNVTTRYIDRFGEQGKPLDEFLDIIWFLKRNSQDPTPFLISQMGEKIIGIFPGSFKLGRVDLTDPSRPLETSTSIPKAFNALKVTSFRNRLIILLKPDLLQPPQLIDWTDPDNIKIKVLENFPKTAMEFSDFFEVDGQLFIASGSTQKNLYLFNLTDPNNVTFETTEIEPYIYGAPFVAKAGSDFSIFARAAHESLVHAWVDQSGKLQTASMPIPILGQGTVLRPFCDPVTGQVFASQPFTPNAETWQIYGPLP